MSPAWNYRIATGASASMVDPEGFEMDDVQAFRGPDVTLSLTRLKRA
jgi:hypothetical protein